MIYKNNHYYLPMIVSNTRNKWVLNLGLRIYLWINANIGSKSSSFLPNKAEGNAFLYVNSSIKLIITTGSRF